jgi:hypothetical protein
MNTTTSNDISFLSWAKQTCIKYPEILDHMRKSTDPLERAIAVRILINAGVSDVKKRSRICNYPESRKGK